MRAQPIVGAKLVLVLAVSSSAAPNCGAAKY
jgi:hypothetical protein